jgi:hypothetical protein
MQALGGGPLPEQPRALAVVEFLGGCLPGCIQHLECPCPSDSITPSNLNHRKPLPPLLDPTPRSGWCMGMRSSLTAAQMGALGARAPSSRGEPPPAADGSQPRKHVRCAAPRGISGSSPMRLLHFFCIYPGARSHALRLHPCAPRIITIHLAARPLQVGARSLLQQVKDGPTTASSRSLGCRRLRTRRCMLWWLVSWQHSKVGPACLGYSMFLVRY